MRISFGIKFQFKLKALSFWTKFAQKGYFQSKTEKVNIATEICIIWRIIRFSLATKFQLNPLQPGGAYLHPLETSENL